MANTRSFTITQSGESRDFTINTGVGPTGPAGSAGSVTNANVNTAIETDPAATRSSLGLPLNNFTSTRAPLTTDDSGDGYAAGSPWIDTETNESYVCVSATIGNAVWKNTSFDEDDAYGVLVISTLPYGVGEMTGTVTLDRSEGPTQYGTMTANTTIASPANGSEGQELSLTFTTTGTWTLNFSGIEFDFDTTGLLPISLAASRAYTLDLQMRGFYWTFKSLSDASVINVTIPTNLTLLYDANSVMSNFNLIEIPRDWTSKMEINHTTFTDLVIGDVVTYIREQAFVGCTGLSGPLVIPNSVVSIGSRAFRECSGYTSTLTLSSSLTEIGRAAFRLCGFTGSLTIPSGVTSIGQNAFHSCSGFTGNLSIPATVTFIDQAAFYDCSGLSTTLTVLAQTITMGRNVWNGCSGLTTLNWYGTEEMLTIDYDGVASNSLANTGITTIHARAADTSWTAGVGQTIGGKSGITVTKDL